ncbi:MAG: RDD family protein [Betaproteobacteria bacterium]|nr:RDD family protein [Betaproteobacteria bacterium]
MSRVSVTRSPGTLGAADDLPLILAPLWPRFGALVYDSILLFGVTFLASWIFVVLVGDSTVGPRRFGYQLYLAAVVGAYFMFCWLRTGQTLAMKTWGLRLVDQTGAGLSPRKAFARYLLALAGTVCGALGFLWALVDTDRQFLHDRLMRTRIVKAPI